MSIVLRLEDGTVLLLCLGGYGHYSSQNKVWSVQTPHCGIPISATLSHFWAFNSHLLSLWIQVWRLRNGKGNYLVFCRKEDPKEQQYSRPYQVWAMGQIWIRCSSCWATGATALEMEKIKHHQSKSSKLLLDANVALVMSFLPFLLYEEPLPTGSLISWHIITSLVQSGLR